MPYVRRTASAKIDSLPPRSAARRPANSSTTIHPEVQRFVGNAGRPEHFSSLERRYSCACSRTSSNTHCTPAQLHRRDRPAAEAQAKLFARKASPRAPGREDADALPEFGLRGGHRDTGFGPL
jgi:hypothetical protein